MKNLIGIDIGGSHITMASISPEGDSVFEDSIIRNPIDASASVNKIISAWGRVIKTSSHFKKDETLIGIAIPGPFDYELGISYMHNQNKYDQLYKKNVRKLLAAELEIAPENLNFINDAASFLLGEMRAGSGKGFKCALGITLGTGLGSSIYKERKVSDADLWCLPFRESIAEDYLSTRWIVKRFFELSNFEINDVKKLAEVYPNHPMTKQVFDEFAENLALFIAEFLKGDSSEVIIIGGNIAKAGDFFMENLKRKIQKMSINTSIRVSSLGEKAAMLGAVQR